VIYVEKIRTLLKQYAEKGKTLVWCTGKKILNRKLSTLKRHCRKAEIIFPDYCPRKLKKKKDETV